MLKEESWGQQIKIAPRNTRLSAACGIKYAVWN